jgi:hypothetical protein
MDDKKDKHDTAGKKHCPGKERTILFRFIGDILCRPGTFIEHPEIRSRHDMADENEEQYIFDNTDEENAWEEFRVRIECRPSILLEEKKIAADMNNKVRTKT